jgi:hypothetical protein
MVPVLMVVAASFLVEVLVEALVEVPVVLVLMMVP